MKKLLRLISVATMLLAATTFMACSSDDDDDDSGARSVSARTSGSVVGVVLDNKGEPVEGATVTLGGKTTKTNYGGEFEITGVNPNDSKLISAAKTVTTTTTVSTVTDNSVTNKPKTDTSMSTSSNTGNAAASTDISNTGYTLTVKKDGYLSGKVTGIFVRYQDTEDPEVTRANALLHGLEYDYQDILDRYAAALTNPNANNGGSVGTTATTTTTATEDTTATTTVQTGSNADRVFKDISEAISALKSLYKTGSYTEYFSDFATSSPLIPLDASLKGRIKLNLKTQNGSVYDANTYIPASKPTIHVSYSTVISPALESEVIQKDANGKTTSRTTNKDGTSTQVIYNANGTTTTLITKTTATGADYTWEVKADANGEFVFDKSLPSGVPLKITVDSFFEKINDVEYTFSSESGVIVVENSKSYENSNIVTLGSKDANVESIVYMLFAQNDKIWVSETNVDTLSSGVLLQTTDALTFTFNKAMLSAEFVSEAKAASGNDPAVDGISNLKTTEYTATWSEDKKTVTLTPKIGYWILSGAAPVIKVSGEAEDGAKTILNSEFKAYFDTKVWVSLKTEVKTAEKTEAGSVSYGDYNDYLSLSSPITLVFSKPMNEKIAVKLHNNTAAYTESWNEAKTELTLTPVTNAKFWALGENDNIIVQVISDFASSANYYNTDFGYWKTGAVKSKKQPNTDTDLTEDPAAENALKVYFDNYNDVTFEKVSDSSFKINFAKALKALTEKELNTTSNLEIFYNTTYSAEQAWTTGTSSVTDAKVELSADGKTITVTAKNGDFENYGYYAVHFNSKVFVAQTGESSLRKDATLKEKEETGKTPFVTPFTLGSDFDYVSVTTVKELPAGVVASRAAFASNEEYLKVTFNKEIKKSELKVETVKNDSVTNTATVKNYIDGAVVYLPLSDKDLKDNETITISGTVTAVTGKAKTYSAKEIKTYYTLAKSYFKMIKSSLYDEKAAIAGKNDVVNPKINPTDTVTFTFDQDISAANVKWTAELYDEYTVTSRNLDNSLYAAKATASGNVLTVALNEKKALENGTPSNPKVYYLSIKAVNREGDDAVVLFDSDKATLGSTTGTTETTTIYYGKVSDGKYLNEKIVTTKTVEQTDYHYIKIQTKEHYVLDVADDSATTKFEDFNKSTKSSIIIEFTQPVAGFKAVLAKSGESWNKYDDIDLTKTFESTVTIDGNKLTITPTYAFPSKEVVDPIVYNTKGEKIDLVLASEEFKDGTKKTLFDDTGSDPKKCFIAKELKDSTKELTEYLDGVTADSALVLTQFNTAEVGNGMDLYFFFKPIVSQRENTAKYGKYTLYKKVTDATTAATLWKKKGDYCVGTEVTGATALQGVNADVKTTSKITDVTVESATAQDFGVRKLMALITVKADATEFNYSKTSEYKLVYTNDNVERYSNTVTVTDAKLNTTFHVGDKTGPEFKADTHNETLGTTETAPTQKTYTVVSTGYMVSGKITTTASASPAATDNRINAKNVTGKFNDDRTEYTITIDPAALAAKGDTIKIEVIDAQEKSQKYTITYK